jgi:23S rRNA (adenine-N6)-dimethyltransferase
VAARSRRGARDRRRGAYGQNLLVDPRVVERLLARLDLRPDELVVDIGAGRGALTLPLAAAGARVLAIERDRELVRDLQAAVERAGLGGRVQLRRADLRTVSWPRTRYRVVANPPFALTTSLLARLLDDPSRGPTSATLLLQREVARKRAAQPAATLRSAVWAPWWRFEIGEVVPREAFRPVPAVDTAWLHIVRRDPPLLPTAMAPGFAAVLGPAWDAHARQPGSDLGRRGAPRSAR